MKLRRVLTQKGPQVEALQSNTSDVWIRLSTIAALDDISQRFSVPHNLATDVLTVLKLGTDGWNVLSEHVNKSTIAQPESDAALIPPLQPSSFRDFLLFEQHFIDASRGFVKRFLPRKYKITSLYEKLSGKTFPKFKPSPVWYNQPLYYFGNHLNFITSGDDIQQPIYSQALDYELELGAVLAKPLFNATPKEAENAIGGYVVLNDLSARDVQMTEMQSGFGPQKAKHFLNAMSGIVITADEIINRVNHLQGSVSIDGVTRMHCTTEKMQYSLGEAIAYASKSEQLHPAELFGSGTLPGGSGMENGYWLQPNNTLCLKINEIDELTNKIVSS
ncbi:MAG: fumarylacetoacetate hydrolase family protein [Gammaproteobacteria bacterium]|nr:fumarylacetoacetate hydrolase family protein [Gammaproteobacteria bacterium]